MRVHIGGRAQIVRDLLHEPFEERLRQLGHGACHRGLLLGSNEQQPLNVPEIRGKLNVQRHE